MNEWMNSLGSLNQFNDNKKASQGRSQSVCCITPQLVYNSLKISCSMWSFSSWYIRESPKPYSDDQFSRWFLCLAWSGFSPSYSATLEQDATDQSLLLEPLPSLYSFLVLFLPNLFSMFTPLSLPPRCEWSPGVCFLKLLFFHFTYSPDPTFCC